MSDHQVLSRAQRRTIFRTILEALPICCEACREDPDGAVWKDAVAVNEALRPVILGLSTTPASTPEEGTHG